MTHFDIPRVPSPSWDRLQGAENPFAVYVNIPFCTAACSFCHYIRNIQFRHLCVPSEYMTALMVQARNVLALATPRRRAVSCSIGGGTPSLLTPSQLSDLLHSLDDFVDGFDEMSIEIHPADWDAHYLQLGRITRFSLGVQTFNQDRLAEWRRLPYSVCQVADIITSIRSLAPTATINVDLFFHRELDDRDVSIAESLGPDSITIYPRTGRKKLGEITSIRQSLRRAKSLLREYTPLGEESFIFRRQAGRGSLYSAHEYVKVGEIVGLGHNSVSFVGPDAYLCLYNDEGYAYRSKYQGDRYLRALLRGAAIGVTEKLVTETDPEVMPFLSQENRSRNLWRIPRHSFRPFYDFLQKRHGSEIAAEFLRSVLYGEDRPEFLGEAQDVPAIHIA